MADGRVEQTAREALLRAMERRGVSNAELARMVGLSRYNTWVTLNTTTSTYLREDTMTRYCTALGCGLVYRPGDGWHAAEL